MQTRCAWLSFQPERFVDVSWNAEGMTARSDVQIEVRALDRGSLLSDLTGRSFIGFQYSGRPKTDSDQVASGNFSFELADLGTERGPVGAAPGRQGLRGSSDRLRQRAGVTPRARMGAACYIRPTRCHAAFSRLDVFY